MKVHENTIKVPTMSDKKGDLRPTIQDQANFSSFRHGSSKQDIESNAMPVKLRS